MTLLQYLDLKLYLQESILVKVDRASMACSLEVRAPFLDHELVEFVMGLPSRCEVEGVHFKISFEKGDEKPSSGGGDPKAEEGFWCPHCKMGKRTFEGIV